MHPRLADAAPNAADFAFPAHQLLGRIAGEWEGVYCFVRTLEDGSRLYGFCSRLQRADGRVEVVCLCTRYPWFSCWQTLLRHVDRMRRDQDQSLEQARRDAMVGTAVEVFSVSSQEWIRGEVTDVEPHRGRDPSQVALFTVAYSATGDLSGAHRTKRVSLSNASVVRLVQQADTSVPLRELTLALLESTWRSTPAPGAEFSITLKQGQFFKLQRPSDGIAPHTEDMNHDALFSAISVSGVMAMFAAMMLEQRLIFVSSQLPKLSACVHAAVALLLPFEWQNIFVPVLPRIWLDYLTAPMPFLVGIHSSFLPEVRQMVASGAAEDQLVFVMLDEGEVKLEGFERSPVDSLPPAPVRRLERRLASLRQQIDTKQWRVTVKPASASGGIATQQDEHAKLFARDVLISFASFMAAVFGHYRKYLTPATAAETAKAADPRGKKNGEELYGPRHEVRATFDIEAFIELRDEEGDGGGGMAGVSIGDATATRGFLRQFRGSQMFEQFCSQRETLGLRPLRGDSNGEWAGDVFETLIRQSALRVGETVGGVDSATANADASAPSTDDQLSAAELRAKSAAATDLFLASGLVAFFSVEARAMIRAGSARDSPEVGILEEGEIIKVRIPFPLPLWSLLSCRLCIALFLSINTMKPWATALTGCRVCVSRWSNKGGWTVQRGCGLTAAGRVSRLRKGRGYSRSWTCERARYIHPSRHIYT